MYVFWWRSSCGSLAPSSERAVSVSIAEVAFGGPEFRGSWRRALAWSNLFIVVISWVLFGSSHSSADSVDAISGSITLLVVRAFSSSCALIKNVPGDGSLVAAEPHGVSANHGQGENCQNEFYAHENMLLIDYKWIKIASIYMMILKVRWCLWSSKHLSYSFGPNIENFYDFALFFLKWLAFVPLFQKSNK